MKNKRNPIARAIKLALYTSVIGSLSISNLSFADDEPVKLDKQEVTGSRIKRSDMEGALPVTVITREQIELSGETSAADLIRNMTFNSTGSFRQQSGSSAQGIATVSLRGLGSNRTLVLIDGRRMPKSPSTGTSQDLNSIPLGAVERIEILTDGASAIYGSDAIGGVINIITRTDYEGVELMLGGSNVSIPTDGGETQEGSILFGTSSDKASIIAGASWNSKDIVYGRNLPWYEQGQSTYGNNFTTVNADGSANFDFRPLGECDFPGTGYHLFAGRCRYDYNLVSADEASTSNKGMYAKVNYHINPSWDIWANTSFSQSKSFGRYAPVPDSSYFSTPLTANSPNNPTNPNSPHYDPSLGLEQTAINWWHRFDALGNRDSYVTNNLLNISLGAKGQIGKFEVDFGVNKTKNRTHDVGRNYLLRSAASAAIESGEYDLFNPYSASEDVLNSMKATIYRESKYDQTEAFASVAFDIIDLSAGTASAFIGLEHRKDKYSDQYDPLSEAGQIGGSAGNSAAGNRTIDSVFFETLVPLLENLEMNIAGRYDDYSDFGSNFSPKISFRYQPLDNLTLRTSYGQGFRAPSLPSLHQKTSFSASFIRDTQSCLAQGLPDDCEIQINDYIQSNPLLAAEESDQFSIGLAYEPTDWVNLTLDYYNISIDNRINQFSAQEIINKEESGDPIPPGLYCDRNADGAVTNCYSGFGNSGTVDNSGIDANVRFNYDFADIRFNTNFQMSRLLSYKVDDGRDFVGDPGVPEFRASLNNIMTYGSFTVSYNINLIDSQFDDVIDGVGEGHVPAWVTHDLQVNYFAPWNGKITIGANNLTGKAPPVGLGNLDGRPYDFNLYDGYGRYTYIRYTQTF
jgi:iron complex outermembrane receptor protein